MDQAFVPADWFGSSLKRDQCRTVSQQEVPDDQIVRPEQADEHVRRSVSVRVTLDERVSVDVNEVQFARGAGEIAVADPGERLVATSGDVGIDAEEANDFPERLVEVGNGVCASTRRAQIALEEHERIAPSFARQPVGARTADEPVRTCTAEQGISTAVADKPVGAAVAVQRVAALAAPEVVVAEAALDRIGAPVPPDEVVAGSGVDGVVPAERLDHVLAVSPGYGVAGGRPVQL